MNRRMLQALAMLSILAIGLWASDSPFTGTWKLNLAKSNDSSLGTAQNVMLTVEALQENVKISVEMTGADGKVTSGGYSIKYDGKDYPVTGAPYGDTVSGKWINERTHDLIWKKNGKITFVERSTVSTNGKTFTATMNGTDAQGRKMHYIHVWDKQ